VSLSVAGVWQVGVWDQTVWADGVWREGAPALAPDAYHSLLSIIQEYGAGALSSITSAGLSKSCLIDPSEGITSIMQSRGRGVSSSIDSTGKSVESDI